MVSIAFCKSNITNYFHCMLEETFKYSVSMLELVSHGTERQNGKAEKGNDGRGKKKINDHFDNHRYVSYIMVI